MIETGAEVVKRYLADTISSQRELESQMESFAATTKAGLLQAVFHQNANSSKRHQEQLTARLGTLGGSVSVARNLLSQFFEWSAKAAQFAHSAKEHGTGEYESEEQTTWNLMTAYTAESNAIATYEALALIAKAAGDPDTEALVRLIQEEEKVAAQKLWDLIPAEALPGSSRA